MFDGHWRQGVDRFTGPVGRRLVRLGVTADILTTSGLVFAVATAVVVATGHLLIGIPLLAITGFHDLFDGPVAKAAGTASVRGALFDSVMDRVADAVVMTGVAWYLVSARDGELALLPLAVLGAASLVSYVRAKSESLGLPVTNGGVFGGLMERAERMILLGAGFLEPWLLVPVLWALLGLTMLTAIARFVTAWRVAEGPDRAHEVQAARSSRFARDLETGPIWRARREGALAPVSPRGELVARWRARRQELESRLERGRESRTARARARRVRADAGGSRRAARPSHGSSRAGHRGLPGSGPGDRGV
ncbi:MAG: CDP-alcohol phosphatidyltransferase family protein [Acidimicrobiales bacterium]